VTEARAMLDRLSGQLDALLRAFEPEGVAAAENLSEMPCSTPWGW